MNRGCKIVKRKRSKRKKLFVALLIIGAIIAAVCIFIKSNVNPMIVTISNERIRALTTDAVSSSVLDVMSENSSVEYLKVTRDDKQNIKSVDMNTAAINDLAQKITLSAQKRINEIGNDGIKIPVGSLSGVTLFTGLGPDINIKIYLVGSTQTQIISMFTSAGINQTLHRLYINIAGSVAVAVPGLPSTIKTSTQVLMSEMIIVGEVPPTYLHSSTVGDMLDLVVK
ncbi:MAG: sporulation protein YunB [Clostridiales bacterium]|uniref:sporulation protein YunB n=1 Tax=Anaerocaecibacter muris TaxID=2941513 RepID=UPI00203D85D4|nr:sporulation protein YunB [Anaerocaecibacter muris]MDE6966877.1 sporulation protein YunB [Clostridiales bacterium]